MENNIYTLLIGIDDYKGQNLNQCVADIRKVESYIHSINQEKYKLHTPELLLDKNATKRKIVARIESIIDALNDDDVFLIYYSGHGTQETSNDRFLDEHNGRIQCLVCHPEDDIKNALLADKELRYLFSKLEAKAHIVSIFDCCHSGEITRGEFDKASARQKKRMSVHFPPRPAENFIFTKEVVLDQFKTKRFNEIFQDKNIITLSASASHESSWEDREGGVFTRNLLKILKQKNGTLNYNDIAKLTRLSIRSTTREKQTPTIDVSGNQHFNQMTSWLNLNGRRFFDGLGSIAYNKNKGWLYNKGLLHGIQKTDKIEITATSGKRIKLPIGIVKLDHSEVDVDQNRMDDLDKEKSYTVIDSPILLKPKIFINDLDDNSEVEENLKKVINENELVELVLNQSESDFDLNIFNQVVYFSFNNDSFRPLGSFLSLIDKEEDMVSPDDLKNDIEKKLGVIQNWHHYSELDIKDEFDRMPIKIELSPGKGSCWTDISNNQIIIEPEAQRSINNSSPTYHGLLYRDYQIKLSNLTDTRLYVTPIALYNGLLEISEPTGENKSIEIDAGKSKIFDQVIFIDHYMEVFNWERECANYKFIVNNHSDLNAELPSILQNGLSEPYGYKGATRGGGMTNEFIFQERNAVFFSKVLLKNSYVNQISGDLVKQQERYNNDEIISPFIQRLYFDIDPKSINLKLKTKPNNGQFGKKRLKMWLGNTIDNYRRKRKFKQLLHKFPDKPVVVAEGDSWFLYPILIKDTLDHLMTEYPIKSLAWAGDTLKNYKKSGALLRDVKELKPKYVMISGGGNDIVGTEIEHILKAGVASGKEPKAYFNYKYEAQMKKLKDLYNYFFTEISKYDSVQNILVHGYDYLRTDHAAIVIKEGWVGKYMIEKGITDYKDRKRIVDFLIDEFNIMLETLANKFVVVTYVKLLDTIKKDEWHDEIHPNDYGYKKIANKFKVHLI